MKKMLYAALAAMVIFVSCSDDDPGTKTGKGENAILSIRISEDAFSKAGFDDIDDPITGLKQGAVTIQGDLYVFLAEGDNIILNATVTAAELVSSNQKVFAEDNDGDNLTTSIDKVIIIANAAGALFPPATIKTVTALKAVVQGLGAAQTDYLAGKIWVQGENSVTWGAADVDGNIEGASTIGLHPVLSRIDAQVKFANDVVGLYATQADFTGRADKTKGGVVLENVAVLYSAKETAFVSPFTPSTASGTVLFSGTATPTGAWAQGKHALAEEFTTTALGKENFLFAEWNGTDWFLAANPNNTNGDANYSVADGFRRSFYAFSPQNYPASAGGSSDPISETTGYKAYTMLTIKGTQYGPEPDELEMTPRYFSVIFAPTDNNGETGDAAKELEPGQRYAVNITMNGDFTNGGNGGTTPEEPGSANLTVTITPAQWKSVITINKDFNK